MMVEKRQNRSNNGNLPLVVEEFVVGCGRQPTDDEVDCSEIEANVGARYDDDDDDDGGDRSCHAKSKFQNSIPTI